MDSSEGDNSLECDSPDEFDLSKRGIVETEVQLSISDECKPVEELGTAFQNTFNNINMKLPVSIQNCIPSALQVSSELVVITNGNAGFLNEQKLPLAAFQTDGGENISKRFRIAEQDGQAFIYTLQDGLDGFSNVVEMQQKNFSAVDAAQLIIQEGGISISNKDGINQNWFTSKEEKVTLHSKGHSWKTGMWSKEEVELLEHNIQLYCKNHDISNPATIVFEMAKDERKDFYRTIAKGLNRPLFSVYRRVIRMYDNKNHVGKYTTEELDKLKKLRSIYGNDWQSIGAAMGRSASSIKDRCRLMRDNCNQGKWQPEEEERLAKAVHDLSNALPGEMISSGLSWAVVADRVGTRSEKQCRTKWLNYLNWKVAGGTDWTREDDVTLICRVYNVNASDESEVDWNILAKDWLSVRSPQWLRGKWWNLKRHVPNANNVTFPELCEFLYQHFVQKLKVKEEVLISPDSVPAELQAMLGHSKQQQALLQSLPDASSSPIMVTASTQPLPPSVVSLTNAQCMDMVSASAPLTVNPMLQTLEVLPQNIQLAGSPHTILLTTPSPQTIPITSALQPNRIIIQTVASESLQRSENVTVEMDDGVTLHMNPPHIIISSSNALTSLASTQVPSAPPSPDGGSSAPLVAPSYGVQTIDESVLNQDGDIEADTQKSNPVIILSDPMLPVGGNTSMANSDTDSEKHTVEDHLDHAQT